MKNVPKLRFKEFSGEWKPKKGSELFQSRREKGKEGIEIYSVTQSDGLIPRAMLEKHMNGDAKAEANFVVHAGDIAYNMMRMWQGAMGLADCKCMVSPAYIVLKPKKATYPDFYLHLFKSYKTLHYFWAYSHGLTDDRLRLYFKDFAAISFPHPKYEEQTKIADFLTAIDDRITQLTQKVECVEQYKKGVMQQIFSQKVRFKDGNGQEFPEWEWKNGNLIFESISDKSHNSDLPILAITQEFGAIPRNMIDFKISVMDSSIDGYKIVRTGNFIISLRSFQGGIEYASYEGICSPAYIVLRSILKISDGFFKRYFKTDNYIKNLQKNLEGIRDGKMISFKYFSEIKLPYPCIAEQEKIAVFLEAVDEKLAHAKARLDAVRQYKQGLLQQMFV